MDLNELRELIDGLDSKMLSLLENRMDAVRKIAHIKRDKRIPVFDPKREAQMEERLPQKLKDPGNLEYAKGLMRYLMDVSKKEQQRVLENE